MSDDMDVLAPRTIKNVSGRVWNIITAGAKREELTVAQWLERRVLEWEADGGPVPVSSPPPLNLSDLTAVAAVMEAMRSLSKDAGLEVPKQLAKDSQALVRKAVRQAKGLPSPSRREKAPQALLEG